ncbi:MAG: guanylate kinase [Alloprevotella sp.]|nr:guanylate kinase [Alloprevotella sp.]
MNKIIVFCAPSGSGKTTIVNYLMKQNLNLHFSISATSRPPRGQETDGVEYYFLTGEEFKQKLDEDAFLEYCEVYPGRYYGTLRSEVDRLLAEGKNVVCDVDVVGAKNIKAAYGDRALTLFIQPPSIEELRRRLEARGTDSPEVIDDRIARAQYELDQAPAFDLTIVNDDLIAAEDEALYWVEKFLNE